MIKHTHKYYSNTCCYLNFFHSHSIQYTPHHFMGITLSVWPKAISVPKVKQYMYALIVASYDHHICKMKVPLSQHFE